MIYLQIFWTFLKIGCLSIGGAYSFLPLIEREAVQNHGWISKTEFLDMWGIASVFPGAISIKFATYIGYRSGGIGGAILANIANLIPPAILILMAGAVYSRYKELPPVKGAFGMVQIAVFAMIIAAAVNLMGFKNLAAPKTLIWAICFFIIFVFGKMHPAFIILGAGLIGALSG